MNYRYKYQKYKNKYNSLVRTMQVGAATCNELPVENIVGSRPIRGGGTGETIPQTTTYPRWDTNLIPRTGLAQAWNDPSGSFQPVVPSHDDGRGDQIVQKHLALCEILNFRGANKRKFDLVREIYDNNVVVRMANEAGVHGIDKQITMMKEMFIMSTDNKVTKHGIQFGSDNWTAVEQIMSGTFDGVAKTPTGKEIQPNYNHYEIRVCSLIRWENDRIVEENIFWDNENFVTQLGLDYSSGFVNLKKRGIGEKIGFVSYGRGDESDPQVRKHLQLFENFSFNGYNQRNWKIAEELYNAKAILIFSNGTCIEGANNIIKQMQTGINDEKVFSIPIHFGSGDWTAASIIMGGTIPNSNGETWMMEHCVLVKWHNDQIIEAHAFWDNAEANVQGIIMEQQFKSTPRSPDLYCRVR